MGGQGKKGKEGAWSAAPKKPRKPSAGSWSCSCGGPKAKENFAFRTECIACGAARATTSTKKGKMAGWAVGQAPWRQQGGGTPPWGPQPYVVPSGPWQQWTPPQPYPPVEGVFDQRMTRLENMVSGFIKGKGGKGKGVGGKPKSGKGRTTPPWDRAASPAGSGVSTQQASSQGTANQATAPPPSQPTPPTLEETHRALTRNLGEISRSKGLTPTSKVL